jgi:hypothetical protein
MQNRRRDRPLCDALFWESREAVKAFAGDAIETARFPGDEKYLLEFEPTVRHYEVFA